MRRRRSRDVREPQAPIAITGAACRFPGADGPEDFWALLDRGADAVTEIPDGRWAKDYYFHPDAAQAGKSYNTANDANRATTLFSQILAKGDPSAVITNQTVQGVQNVATTNAVASTVSSTINAIAAGLLR